MIRKIYILGLIILCYILQVTFLKMIAIGSISPNLLIILTASFGLLSGKKEGMWIGFVAGLLADVFAGTVAGINALIYMYTGYVSGIFSDSFYSEDIKIPVLLISLSNLVYGVMNYGFSYLLRGRLDFLFYLKRIILAEVTYTIVLTILTYRLFKWIHKRLDQQQSQGVKSVV